MGTLSLFKKLEDFEEIEICCNFFPEYSKKLEYLSDKKRKAKKHLNYCNYVLAQKVITTKSFNNLYLKEYLKSFDPLITDFKPHIEMESLNAILIIEQIETLKDDIKEKHEIEKVKMKERSLGLHIKKIPWSKSLLLLQFLFQLLKNEKLIHKDTEWLVFLAHFCLENEDPYCEVLVSIQWIGSEYKLAQLISILKVHGIINSRSFFADCEGHFVNKDGLCIKNFSEKKYHNSLTDKADMQDIERKLKLELQN